MHSVNVLMVMSRKYESTHIFRIIKAIDEDAFVTQAKVHGVYGEGFDHVKIRLQKQNSAKPADPDTTPEDANTRDVNIEEKPKQ